MKVHENVISQEKHNITNVLQSFSYLPRILILLWESNPRYFLSTISLTILAGLIPAGIILITEELINRIGKGSTIGFSPVLITFSFLVALTLANSIINTVNQSCQIVYQDLITKQINLKLMMKANRLSFEYFEDSNTHDNLQRARDESVYRPYQIFNYFMVIISSFFSIVSLAGILIMWKWWLVLLLLIIPVFSAFTFFNLGEQEFKIKYRQVSLRRRLHYFLRLMTFDHSVKEIKVYNLGSIFIKQYKTVYDSLFLENRKMIAKRTNITLIFSLLNLTAIAIALVYIIGEAYIGHIMIGSLIAYMQIINKLESLTSTFFNAVFGLYQNNLYISHLFGFFDLPEKSIVDKKDLRSIQVDNHRGLEFRNVSFKYPNRDEYSLKNVSFCIYPGETVAIVGENGSGKSTIAKLITRLYEVTEGTILFNGKPIMCYTEEEWRNKIGIMFQDYLKYELKARENIGFGNIEKINDDYGIMETSKLTGVDQLINKLPNQLDSQLGVLFEDGIQLSGGQWQKIACSRVYMRDAELYLLDEPTASLDPESETAVFKTLQNLTTNKVGIFISHRYSSVRQAQKIIVLQQGEIVESGTHFELMLQNGLYAKLYNIQAVPFIENDEQLEKIRVGQM